MGQSSLIQEYTIPQEIINEALLTLDSFKEFNIKRPDGINCTVNGFHTGNILRFKTTHELAEKLYSHIPFPKKYNIHHLHLIHFEKDGFEQGHDHAHNEDYSFILYLQDSDGPTVFQLTPENIVKIQPKCGKLVFFKSNIWHWGEKSSGNKKILVGGMRVIE